MFEITSAPNLDRAEASDYHVFQYLLCQGAERIIRIGRIEIVSEDAYAQICIRQLFSATRPRLNSPPHPGNLIFDRVDRLSRHRRFSKTSQVGWRRLWVRIGPRTIGVQDGRQGHGSPLALRTSAAMVVWISLSRIIPSTKPMSARSRSRSSSITAINLATELSRSRMLFAIPGKREASISP